jgi:integrase
VSFLMMTGARGSEAAELTWDRVDLVEDGVSSWHLPDPKNGRPVTFPLSNELANILRTRKASQPDDERFVFPCWGSDGHITDARGVLTKISRVAGLPLTRHDLRRTFTGAALHCGLEMWKTELLTGHVPQTVTLKHYMETSDLRYLASDLEIVTAWILREGVVAKAAARGENVVPLRA